MYIDNYNDAIKNCRFCFMCRHLSAVGNVTFTEEDTPRVRAAMIYGLTLHPEQISDPDFINTIYRSDLSACCRFHCVSHFDENGLNLAMRADIVDKGLEPEYVKNIADDLKSKAKWSCEGSGEVLYFKDYYTQESGDVSAAFDSIMKKANISYQTVTGGCIGKALYILGYRQDAKATMEKFAEVINNSNAKTVVVSNPAAYDALLNNFREFGIAINAKVMHTSEFINTLDLGYTKSVGKVYYLESDYLRNYNNSPAPRALLEKLNAQIIPFGTNNEESYSCGEGAVVLPKINEALVEKMAKYVANRADNPQTDLIAVASPYTKIMLSRYTDLKVKTLEELTNSCL